MEDERGATLSGDASLPLPEFDAPPIDPLGLLAGWIDRAVERRVREPLALTLATTEAGGGVSTRVVLVKAVDERGLVFTTHLGSRKGRDLTRPAARAAGSLYWRETLQQVNVAGPVELLTAAEADALFDARPAEARATAIVSTQGRPLSPTDDLAADARRLLDAAAPLVRPADWGGFRIAVDHAEFWHGSPDRLHRRLAYAQDEGVWTWQRLQP